MDELMLLETDLLEGSTLSSSISDEPTFDEVMAAFHCLDGESRTQLWLHAPDGSNLLVTGPANGRYALDLTFVRGTYLHAVDSTQPYAVMTVAAGQDLVELPRRELLTSEMVKAALSDFFNHQAASGSVTWEHSD